MLLMLHKCSWGLFSCLDSCLLKPVSRLCVKIPKLGSLCSAMYLVVPVIEYYGEVWGPDLLLSCETLDRLCDNELRVTESLASDADEVGGSAPK